MRRAVTCKQPSQCPPVPSATPGDAQSRMIAPGGLGFGVSTGARASINVGHKLKTAMYLHWRRQREEMGHIGGERTIDLVANIAVHIDRPEVYEREIGGLQCAAGRIPRDRAGEPGATDDLTA